MALNNKLETQIINFVRDEPRTIQEISKKIGKSWVTTDSYVNQIETKTGLIKVKVFRKDTKGAIKLVYFSTANTFSSDLIKEELYKSIKHSKWKENFDFMDIYQFVSEKSKHSFIEKAEDKNKSYNQNIMKLFNQADKTIYVFSGNLSFVNIKEGKKSMTDILEDCLKRKVFVKILTRINLASITNINQIKHLIQKYPNQIEIKHKYQPLRGFVIDNKIARFKDEQSLSRYKEGELDNNLRIFYEIYDKEWVEWIQNVFWNLSKMSIDYNVRLKELLSIANYYSL